MSGSSETPATRRVSHRLRAAVKLSPERQYRLAAKAGFNESSLSRLINGVVPVRPGDPRVLTLARLVGVPDNEAFE